MLQRLLVKGGGRIFGSAMATSSGHVNRLSKERSPYLLQHAANPVDWYPWGEEAFAREEISYQLKDKVDCSVGFVNCFCEFSLAIWHKAARAGTPLT